MRITESQLKQLIKEEIEHIANTKRLHDMSVSREGTPTWYSGPGGVADRIDEMAKEIRTELDNIKQRLRDLEDPQDPSRPDFRRLPRGHAAIDMAPGMNERAQRIRRKK